MPEPENYSVEHPKPLSGRLCVMLGIGFIAGLAALVILVRYLGGQ